MKRKLLHLLLHSVVVGLALATPPALPGQTLQELKEMVDELQKRIRILEEKEEKDALDTAKSREKSAAAPVISAGAGGFSLRSGDTNFVLKIRGYLQTDGRFFADDFQGGVANDTFLMRRVRPIFEGTVFEKYDYRVMLDFGSGATSTGPNNGFVQDAYLNARLSPAFQVQAGKFKEPVGLERLQSAANLLFVERSYPTQLLPNRDVGIQAHGSVLGGF